MYANATGQDACGQCPLNEYNPKLGKESCSLCPDGQYTAFKGSATCVSCFGGSFLNTDKTECVECDAGKASDPGATTCTACTAGKFAAAGASYCATVEAGKEVVKDGELRVGAASCTAGRYSTGSVDSCTDCTGPTFSCTACEAGTFFTGVGADACTECEAGTWSGEGEASCQECQAGKAGHRANDEHTDQEVCPMNTFSFGATQNCSRCTNGGHSKAGSASCDRCSTGTYYEAEASQCLPCPVGTASLSGAPDIDGCDACVAGETYQSEIGQAICLPCSTCGLGEEVGLGCTVTSDTECTQCEAAYAGLGGNDSCQLCSGEREAGHIGPYCNLCVDGYAPDAFQLCQECKTGASDVAYTLVILVVGLVLLVGLNWALNKKVFKKNPKLKRSLKTGLKILFVSTQILAALPSIVPAIELPENYKEAVESVQVFNLNPFTLVGVGCYNSGWNLNWMLLSTTVLPLVLCGVLAAKKKKDAAIAVTFLVLPTVTTTIFKIFPCDDLGNEKEYLHADYSLSCKSASHQVWVAYGVAMVLVWPIGVLGMYAALLWKNRAKIKQEEEEREKDEALMQSAFLWEPYKPSFWWFEIFETARRLAMTGVLGAISPGSDVQLASGIVMTFGGTMVYCICMPFSELKDNILGILTNAQIFLVMLTAM
ncbi:hypothetical protein TeGR_g6673, partial [Tetraparma gracilis]